MKKSFLITLAFCFAIFTNALAKDVVTKASFKVSGNCESCKKRIEKAAKLDGVKTAVWNQETKVLTTTFAPAKITVEQIEQSIAKAGYDTEKFKADETAYKNLPHCCQYEK